METTTDCNEPIHWWSDRAEHETCERGTEGCAVDHTNHPGHPRCETW